MDPEVYKKLLPGDFLDKFLDQNVRCDGRGFNTRRQYAVQKGLFNHADGSGSARCGATHFVCGVRAEIGVPKEDEPKMGRIVVRPDFSPICHAEFSNNRKSVLAESALKETLEDILRNPRVFDREQLCIEEANACWVLFLDVICLEYDGNAFDAPLLASIAALADTHLPAIKWLQAEAAYVIEEDTKGPKVSVVQVPMPLTFSYLHSHWLVDPTFFEEQHGSTLSVCRIDGDWMVFRQTGDPLSMEDFWSKLFPTAEKLLPIVAAEFKRATVA